MALHMFTKNIHSVFSFFRLSIDWLRDEKKESRERERGVGLGGERDIAQTGRKRGRG